MNEIRNNGVNLSTVSLGQIQHMTQSSPVKQADELESMLNRTLGSSSTGSAQSGELSLDVIMSGSLNGYLGVSETAMSSLESPLASAQVLSPSASIATVQEEGLNLSLETSVPSSGTIKIPHTEEVNKTGTIQIAKVDLNGPINTIKIAKVDLDGPINAIKIAKIDSDSPSVLSQISSKESPLAQLPSETLSNVAFSMEVNEVALGLVPGENFTPSQSQAIAAALAPNVSPSETIAATAGTINPQVIGAGQVTGELAINLPAETIADWERSKPVALADNQVSYGGLSLDVPASLSAMALEKGENFDAVAMTSLPVVEGNRSDYRNAWNGISDTLSAYEGTSSQGVIGLAEFNGPAGLNTNTLGLNLDTGSDNNLVGINDAEKSKELLGYTSFVSKDLLGYMERASYSSLIGYNVHPTSVVSALNPGKYISNMLYGYNS